VTAPTDAWDPAVYGRFADERSQPFNDLLALCRPVPGGRAVDLGCGSGELTARVHDRLGLATTVGLDSSAAMLERAEPTHPGIGFVLGDMSRFGTAPEDVGAYDVVFSNAALHWAGVDHPRLLAQWAGALRPGGQLAVQVPANLDHPSHTTSAELAQEEPFLSALGGSPPPDPVTSVLRPEHYAEALYATGFTEQHVRLQVYGHVLGSTAEVVDWVSGTSLTRFRSRLSDELYAEFLERYRQRLLHALGERRPYFYAFKRILFWGRWAG
jgi:trans-aconitate 2-methyltransferase